MKSQNQLVDIEKIIEGCKNKDDICRKKLYDLYANKFYAICLRYSNNAEDAKDTLQDGFITIFEKIGDFKHIGSFEGWMKRILINIALMRFRKKDNRHQKFEDSPTMDMGYEQQIESELSATTLMNCINTLTPQYKIVFNLYALEGYSHKEISQMLEISEGTSKSNLARARKILQEKVSHLYKIKEKVI